MLRLAMRRAKIQKMVFYGGGNEQGNSSSRKSKESGSAIVIMDDATQDISTLYGSCAGYSLIRQVFLGFRQVFRWPMPVLATSLIRQFFLGF